MKIITVSGIALVLLLLGCEKRGTSKTTDTDSSAFATLAEKQEFLERYVTFRRTYDDLDFTIAFFDGENGLVPGPTQWDIRIMARVPATEIEQWLQGLTLSPSPDLTWISKIPNAPADSKGFKWYEDSGRVVGVDSEQRIIFYRSYAN